MLLDAPGRLRALMQAPDLIWGPGVYDGISARIAAGMQFPILYMTGAGTSASRIGEPDLGLTSLNEMVENARVIANASSVPVICDADTGFGGPVNVARTVHLYEMAGVAAIHIEDQTFPKRCGQLQGKTVVPVDEFLQRIHAAVNERYNPEFVVIARTDARQPNGFDDAMDRIVRAFDAGADVGFFEGAASLAEIQQVAREAPGPMMLNLAPNPHLSSLRVDQVQTLGYRFAIWPTACVIPAALAIARSLAALKADGTDAVAHEGKLPRDLFEMVGLADALGVDERSQSVGSSR